MTKIDLFEDLHKKIITSIWREHQMEYEESIRSTWRKEETYMKRSWGKYERLSDLH